MILSHDRERGRVSLSTKKLEPTPGDMIRNPKLVFEKVSSLLARVIYFCCFCTDAACSLLYVDLLAPANVLWSFSYNATISFH